MPYELQLAWAWWNATDILWRWTMAFMVTQVLDGLTTYIGLRFPGSKEGNPVIRWVMDRIGVVPTIISIKALYMCGMYYGAAKMGVNGVIFWTVAYTAVVIWNVGKIQKYRKAAK